MSYVYKYDKIVKQKGAKNFQMEKNKRFKA